MATQTDCLKNKPKQKTIKSPQKPARKEVMEVVLCEALESTTCMLPPSPPVLSHILARGLHFLVLTGSHVHPFPRQQLLKDCGLRCLWKGEPSAPCSRRDAGILGPPSRGSEPPCWVAALQRPQGTHGAVGSYGKAERTGARGDRRAWASQGHHSDTFLP